MTGLTDRTGTSRRAALRAGTIAGAALLTSALLRDQDAAAAHAAAATYDFNQGWLFGPYASGSTGRHYDDSSLAPVTLPHTVTPLSWAGWDPASWEDVWIYRKHFEAPPAAGGRVFADFDGVMTNAAVALNGVPVTRHLGGYLPWSAELTRQLRPGRNVLAVAVDARWLPVPPSGAPGGAASVDFLQPGGIYRDARLRVVPEVFLADVFARPVAVLSPGRGVRVKAIIQAGVVPRHPVRLTAVLLDGHIPLAAGSARVRLTGHGRAVAHLHLSGIGPVTLWSPDTPKLYQVRVTLSVPGQQPHTVAVRTGFREAVFRPDGFFLNGERLKIFGLNRHQLFPFTGMAAPARLQRRDAEILRRDLNCNMVRCSHYPQSPHFLNACDELGLMVWQEPPGWHYIGGPAWRDLAAANMRDMVVRDRSRPSVIVWGARLNETRDQPRLYRKLRRLARRLDGSRPTSGAMAAHSTDGWAGDVFGYDDYDPGRTALEPPLPGVPYLVSEAVGAVDGPPRFRWTDPGAVLATQAWMHARVHSIAGRHHRYAGLLGWAAIDYASLNGGDRVWRALKTPGVIDTFRVAKPAAAVYRSQVDPGIRPVILPVFWWDSGPAARPYGPGPGAMIATNCDRLEIYAGGRHLTTAVPDHARFGGLRYPPAFADLPVAGPGLPELRIDGYVRDRRVASLRMSADPSRDRLDLTAEDRRIEADGSDATRLTFRAVDAYGNHRPGATGLVTLTVTGPAVLIGDNPFDFTAGGGVGGAFLRSLPGRTGRVAVTARHAVLGPARAEVTVARPAGRRFR